VLDTVRSIIEPTFPLSYRGGSTCHRTPEYLLPWHESGERRSDGGRGCNITVPARASLVANEMIASTITSSVIIALSFAAAASAHASCTKRSHPAPQRRDDPA
jgi:hypothetical protein